MAKPQPRVPHPENLLDLPWKWIALTQGQYARVDVEHFERANEFNWHAWWNPCTKSFYACHAVCGSGGKRTTQRLHNFVAALMGLDLSGGRTVDHRDCDSLNNRSANLRTATRTEQSINRRKQASNTSGFIGVVRHQGRWMAKARPINYLGMFGDPVSAAWVRDNYVREHHGGFAVLNNPPERRSVPR